jgi:predicted  nucleic acid-binding Zn-ribbon protein
VEQLNDRSSEIQRCSERSSLYQDSLEKGEAAIKERKDYIRMLSLECTDLRRTVESTKRTMPDICMYRERISRLEEDLLTEKRNIDELSEGMEDPSNSRRARPLEGDDLETDQLIARLDVLEHRLHVSQNMLLDKEVTLEDISLRCREIEEQETKQNQEVSPLIQELTIARGRANDLSRTLISLMSELRMYQKSNLALTEDKAAREHALAVSRRALENGKPPSEEARRFRQLKESRKGNEAEDGLLRNDENNGPRPRTNAYVPVDGTKAIPFGGAHAPFQPCVSAGEGHMRHYRAPRVLTIEEMEQQANEVLQST